MKIVRMALVASILIGSVSFAAGSAEARHHHRVCVWHNHHRHCSWR